MSPLNVRTRPSALIPCSSLTPPLCRFDALLRPGGGDEALEEAADRLSGLLVHEPPVLVEVLPGDREGDLRLLEHDGAGIEQRVSHLLLRAASAALAGRGAHDCDGLPAQDRRERRAR